MKRFFLVVVLVKEVSEEESEVDVDVVFMFLVLELWVSGLMEVMELECWVFCFVIGIL